MSGVRGRMSAPTLAPTLTSTSWDEAALAAMRAKNSGRHHVPQRDRNINDIALRHARSRLPGSRVGSPFGEDTTVTTALTLDPGMGREEEEASDVAPPPAATAARG